MTISIAGPSTVSAQAPSGTPTAQRQEANSAGFVAALASTGVDVYRQTQIIQAEESRNGFERDLSDILTDPNEGYLVNRGKVAVDSREDYDAKVNALRDQYAGALTGLARQEFERVADTLTLNATKTMDAHQAREFRQWETTTKQSTIEGTLEQASRNWIPENRGMFDAYLQVGRRSLAELGALEGWDANTLEAKKQTYESSYKATAVETALSEAGSEQAETLLAEFSDQIEAKDRLALRKRIDVVKEKEEIEARVTQVQSLASGILRDTPDRAEAFDRIEEAAGDDVDLLKDLRSEVTYRMSQRDQYIQEDRTQIVDDVLVSLRTGSLSEYIAANGDAWSRLSETQRLSLEKTARKTVETDWVAYNNLMALPPKQLAKVDPNKYIEVLAPSERKTLLTAIGKAKAGGVDAQVGQSLAAQTQRVAFQLFGDPTTWNEKKQRYANEFFATVDAEVVRRGGSLTSTEYTDLLREMAGEVIKGPALTIFGMDIGTETTDFAELVEDSTPDQMALIREIAQLGDLPMSAGNLSTIADRLEQVRKTLKQQGRPTDRTELIRGYMEATGASY